MGVFFYGIFFPGTHQVRWIDPSDTRLLKKRSHNIDEIHYREGITDKLQQFTCYPVSALVIHF
jgi:hypothetical protein